jgi:hypothetical protein
MSDVFSISIVRFNGIDYRTKPGWEFDLGGVNRTSQYASGKRSGTSQEPMASRASGAVEIMSDTDLETLRNFKDGLVEYVTDVGKVYSAPNSSLTTPPKLQDGGRGAQIEVEGDVATLVP